MIALKGFRTKLSAIFAGIPLSVASIGALFDSPVIMNFIESNPIFSLCYAIATYLSTHHYRNEATKKDVSDIVQDVWIDPKYNKIEADMAEEISGDYNA